MSAEDTTELRTDRLVLRPMTPTDREWLHRVFVHPEVRRYLWDDRIVSVEEVRAIVAESTRLHEAEGTGLWIGREGGRPVGFAGFWPFHDQMELLYGLEPEHFGRGLATEMAARIVRYGFEALEMPCVVGSTDPPNAASVRVMERLGMRHTGTRTIEGLPTAFYMIERPEWERPDASRE